MRVGVQRLDLQHLKIEKLEEMCAQLIPKFLRRTLREEVFQVAAGHQGHRQHFVGRVLAKNARHLDERQRRQPLGQEFDIVSLTQVVRFSDDLLFNLVNRRFWYVAGSLCRLREGAKQSKVVFDRPADARILNLHGDALALASDGMMHLTK